MLFLIFWGNIIIIK